MSEYNKLPTKTFNSLVMGAGVMLKEFDPKTGTVSDENIIGATSDGMTFNAVPSFQDLGQGIDNCAQNLKEAKILDAWAVTLAGTLRTVDPATAKSLLAGADIDGEDDGHIIPRNELKSTDFADIWLVADYGVRTGKYIAIHLTNALSTDGLQIKTNDKDKGAISFTYTAHGSVDTNNAPPFDVYIKTK